MTNKRDFYDVLGVGKKATAAEIKKAYRQKALQFHPDRNKSADSEAKFKEINEAYEVLSNSQKKQAYDQFGHAAFSPGGGFGNQPGRGSPFTYTYTTSSGGNPFAGFDFGGFSDPFEIFNSFFGGVSPFGRARPTKPHYSIKIDLLEAYKGTQKTIVHQGKQHQVKIPPGANDGTRIRYSEFDVSVDILPHQTFKREGADIIIDHKIDIFTASLGATQKIPTLDGDVKIKIKAGTQPLSLIRLKGKGMPYLRSHNRGDQYIRIIVQVPKSLNRNQKKLLQKLQANF